VCLTALAALVGCSGLGTLHPVKGTAKTADGQALKEGWKIHFSPDGWKPAVQVDITGKVKASGEYEMETTSGTSTRAGVPAGKYKVYVSTLVAAGKADVGKLADPSGLKGQAVINKKYENPADSDMKVTVPGGPFDLSFGK